MAKTPQSLPFFCCCTGIWTIPLKLGPSKFIASSLISLEITDYAKLFNKLTCPGTHPIELKQTQWLLFTWTSWTNSVIMISNCLIGPRVGLWKPVIRGFTFAKRTWASWTMVQSSHPVGEVMISHSAWVRLAMRFCFSIAMLVFFTTFTNVMSSAELSWLELVWCCNFLPLQLAKIQVVLLLFGIRLKPIHDKWKYLPYLQSELWHSTSLSLSLGLLLHTQMAFMAKAGEGVLDFLVDWADFPFCLNFGKVLQFGQYHVLGTLTICKQERWKLPMGHSGLQQMTVSSSVAVVQKHTSLFGGWSTLGVLYFRVYHLQSTSANTYVFQKLVTFGKTKIK